MMKSPTKRLVAGLAFTLVVISGYAFYTLRSVWRMREVQTGIVDRNRKASLQLIRIQGELNGLGLAMRDMMDESEGYTLEAWRAPLARVRENLDDAMAKEAVLSGGNRSPEQMAFLKATLGDFWRAADAVIGLAKEGETKKALGMVRDTLQPRLEALNAQTARLLVGNNEVESRAGEEVREIYAEIERNSYVVWGVTLGLIVLTSAGLIRSNRNLFAQLTSLSEQRSDLARQLIATQESTFRAISRDLHDEFGQILTALGAMLRRAQKQAPDSAFREQTQEASVMVQGTLDRIRSLSQSLQPVILEEQGLAAATDWHLKGFERHTGIGVRYEGVEGELPLSNSKAIHVFRILQEALNNVAKHAEVMELEVCLEVRDGVLLLSVVDQGKGMRGGASNGVGLAGMRERAALIGGEIEIGPAQAGGVGTRIRLRVPMEKHDGD